MTRTARLSDDRRSSRRRGRTARTAVAAALALTACLIGSGASRQAGADTIDGQHAGGGRLPAGAAIDVRVTGRGGVPVTGVDAVALNVTAIAPTEPAYLTVWPAGTVRPVASNLNVAAGETRPNMVIAKVGAGGQVSVYNATGTVHIAVDVLGWFPTGSVTSLTPARLLDTRPDAQTVDGQQRGIGSVPGGALVPVTVSGRGGVPVTGAAAVALNVTAAGATEDTFITAWPSGTARPHASNLNVRAGATAANLTVIPVGADGRVQLYTEAGSVDLVVDVLAWFPAGPGSYQGLTPARLVDTRRVTAGGGAAGAGSGGSGGDGGSGSLRAGEIRTLTVLGRAGVPSDGVEAVALNVTVTGASAASFLTVWPAGRARPLASNLNYPPGATLPNMVIAKVGVGGAVALYNEAGTADVVVDVLGWFPSGGGYRSLDPARLADTRPAGTG